MKSKFLKNIGIFAFSMFSVLIYFKILTYYINVDTLAMYFKIKAFGLILYYFFSFRYSEFAYILKAQNSFSLFRMKNIFGLYSILVLVFSIFLITVFNLFDIPVYLYITSYLIFLLNDIVDSYIAINRLYHRYMIIFFIKGILIVKPVLFYLILLDNINSINNINYEDIFLFELYFHLIFAIFIFYLVLKNTKLKNLFLYKKVYVNNILNIKNTWLGSISKIPYEALPTYLLSLFTSSIHFVEYNIARKVYSMTIYANQPFLQVLNTFSIEYKNNFKKYCILYYTVLILLNIFIGIIIFWYGEYAIVFLSNKMYVTQHTLILIYIMFSLYMVYNMIYPFRQYLVLRKYLYLNNKATIYSIIILLVGICIFIPIYKTYAMSIIQPIGLILPLVITMILLKGTKKYESK